MASVNQMAQGSRNNANGMNEGRPGMELRAATAACSRSKAPGNNVSLLIGVNSNLLIMIGVDCSLHLVFPGKGQKAALNVQWLGVRMLLATLPVRSDIILAVDTADATRHLAISHRSLRARRVLLPPAIFRAAAATSF
jgi:hypothetical protein